MAASYPSSAKTFTAIVDGVDYPQATQLNQSYDEIAAVEQALLSTGLAHNLTPDSSANARTLGSTSKFWGLAYLKGLTVAAATELTVATGAVTATQTYHKVDTEADAASDDLDTITAGTGLQEGSVLVVRAENVARVVTVKDGTGNLLLNGDYALSATDRTITLLYDGTNWRELARAVGGSTKPFLQWTASDNQPPASAYATPDTRNSHPVLDFDAASDESAIFGGVLPTAYNGGGLTVEIFWAATSATTGDVVWEAAIERIDASSLDIDADSFAAAQTATTTAPGTNGQVVKSAITFTAGAQMDSLAAGEAFRVKVTRNADAVGDTLTGDAELVRVVTRET